ncbi:MAG TPA: sulfotransferase [Solirubrobacteraceae bacterium]|nr:sulfotransferase [Solirubrobacteraceae bacterium]
MAAETHSGDAMVTPATDCSGGRVPDFFIVGHPKCGTTALYEMLKQHPQIHMPAKEPRFFVMKEIDLSASQSSRPGSLSPPRDSPQASDSSRAPGWRPRTLDGYVALFAGARPEQLVGEATPAYLRSALAPGRIAALRPDARIVAILREPASFLRSFHLLAVRGYFETQKDFRKALALEQQRREGLRIPRTSRALADQLLYLDHVRYVEQLRRYHAAFGREQVLVLIYEDFRRDNEAAVGTVLRFLGVDHTYAIDTMQTRPSRDLRFHRLHRLVNLRRIALRNMAVVGSLSRTVSALTPTPLRGGLQSRWRRVAYGEAPPPDEEFMRELRRRLKPEVEALSDYLGRDLVTAWGYDDLA